MHIKSILTVATVLCGLSAAFVSFPSKPWSATHHEPLQGLRLTGPIYRTLRRVLPRERRVPVPRVDPRVDPRKSRVPSKRPLRRRRARRRARPRPPPLWARSRPVRTAGIARTRRATCDGAADPASAAVPSTIPAMSANTRRMASAAPRTLPIAPNTAGAVPMTGIATPRWRAVASAS